MEHSSSHPTDAEPDDEYWAMVGSCDDWFNVSDHGRIYDEWEGRYVPLQPHHKTGYLQVRVHRGGVRRWALVHVLVLESFVCERPEGMQAAHENGVRTDNRLSNLSWKKATDNILDQVRHGTHAFARRKTCPRNHKLVAPNLVRCLAKRGYRDCLACNRARATRSNRRKRDGVEIDWIPLAHANYAEIMKSEVSS